MINDSAHEQITARAITVPCPVCGVQVGQLCLTNSGRTALYPHSKRLTRANAAHAEEARRG